MQQTGIDLPGISSVAFFLLTEMTRAVRYFSYFVNQILENLGNLWIPGYNAAVNASILHKNQHTVYTILWKFEIFGYPYNAAVNASILYKNQHTVYTILWKFEIFGYPGTTLLLMHQYFIRINILYILSYGSLKSLDTQVQRCC